MLLCVGNKLSRVSCWRFMDMMMYWAGRELCFFFPFLDLLTIEYQKFFFLERGETVICGGSFFDDVPLLCNVSVANISADKNQKKKTMPTPLMPVLGGCWREGNFAGTGLQLRETETQQTQSVPHVHTCRQRIESFHANRTRLAVFTLPHLLYTNCFPVVFFSYFFFLMNRRRGRARFSTY